MYENLHMFEKANISPISAPLCYVYECNLFYRFGAHKLEIASSPLCSAFSYLCYCNIWVVYCDGCWPISLMLIHFLETITIIWPATVIAIFIGPLHLVATADAAILVPSRPCRIAATHLGIGCPLMKSVSTSSSGELRWHGFQKDGVSVWQSWWWSQGHVPDYFQLYVIIQMYPYYCNVGQ